MYLVDTNVWLERLLDQEQSDQVGRFLDQAQSGSLLITDFSLHSIGIVLTRFGREQAFLRFVQDVLIDAAVPLASVGPEQMPRLVQIMSELKLDFDDAYQYVVAETRDAVIVSLDADFDRTERGRKTPSQLVAPR